MYILPLPLEPLFFFGDPWGFFSGPKKERRWHLKRNKNLQLKQSPWMLTKHDISFGTIIPMEESENLYIISSMDTAAYVFRKTGKPAQTPKQKR